MVLQGEAVGGGSDSQQDMVLLLLRGCGRIALLDLSMPEEDFRTDVSNIGELTKGSGSP